MLKFKKYVPFANRVLIRRSDPETKTKGGIIIPDSQKSEVNFGVVVAAGPGLTFTNGVLRSNAVSVGQTVLLPSYAGTKIKLGDEQEYWVYRDDDIIGTLEEPVDAKAAKK
jgi:chaperonin GroES